MFFSETALGKLKQNFFYFFFPIVFVSAYTKYRISRFAKRLIKYLHAYTE